MRIYWNVDTQKDFMRKGGNLYVEGAQKLEENLAKLTQYARKNNERIISTGDWHTKRSKELSDNPDLINTFPPHCIIGTEGAEYIKATEPLDAYVLDWRDKEVDTKKLMQAKEIVIYKDAFDVFDLKKGNPYTKKVIDALDPEQAVVYGVATNVCVDYAVMGLLERGINVLVAEDAIKGLPDLPLEETLDKWKENGAKFNTTYQIIYDGD